MTSIHKIQRYFVFYKIKDLSIFSYMMKKRDNNIFHKECLTIYQSLHDGAQWFDVRNLTHTFRNFDGKMLTVLFLSKCWFKGFVYLWPLEEFSISNYHFCTNYLVFQSLFELNWRPLGWNRELTVTIVLSISWLYFTDIGITNYTKDTVIICIIDFLYTCM